MVFPVTSGSVAEPLRRSMMLLPGLQKTSMAAFERSDKKGPECIESNASKEGPSRTGPLHRSIRTRSLRLMHACTRGFVVPAAATAPKASKMNMRQELGFCALRKQGFIWGRCAESHF